MAKDVLSSREFNLAVLCSLGLPAERCSGVSIDSNHNGLVAVDVTYLVTHDDLAAIAKAVSAGKKA